MNTNPQFVPVGTVVAYAGEVSEIYEQLEKQGWLVCDGREIEAQNFPELFESIGTAFGTTAEGLFNIPDLRGLFIRGTNGTNGADPDADSRVALLDGGNTKNEVGSYQDYATAVPKNPFRASIPNNNIVSRSLDSGCKTANSGEVGADNTTGPTVSGGDLETRPINKYVFYLIKKSTLNQFKEQVTLPVGAVIPFSGLPNQSIEQQFIACIGESISGLGKFKKLFEAIKYAHGEGTDGKFFLPDFRGYFLRGVDNQAAESRRDPDAATRTSPIPGNEEGKRGNSGDKVGSVENDATAYPQSGAFNTLIPRLPKAQGNQAISGTVKHSFNWNPAQANVSVPFTGGDPESRPVNRSVNWYIKFE